MAKNNINTNAEEHPFPDFNGLFDIIGDDITLEEMDDKVRSFAYEDNKWMYETFACFLLDSITLDYYKYDDKFFKTIKKDILFQLISWYAEKLDSNYYKAVIAFFRQDRKLVKKYLTKYSKSPTTEDVDNKDILFNENDIGIDYLRVFKNGYPGFWEDLAEILKSEPCEKYLPELLKAISLFYESSDSEEIRNALINVGRSIADGYITNELLALSYEEDKMWKNALSYYEAIPNENSALFYDNTLAFKTAWAASKARDPKKAIVYYKKCIKIDPTYLYVRNNLGFELYKSKQYDKAKAQFEKLLNNLDDVDKSELPFIYNNYTRVLLALKEFDKAKEFVDSHKVGKSIAQSVKRAIEKKGQESSAASKQYADDDLSDDDGVLEEEAVKNFGKKKTQFSTEKILEDELESKLLNGIEVFGTRLKMYEHEGDMYGRQYVIPIGRLDLLCEDDKGNLWIIELKKDAGYDDPYEQTAAYIDWFEKNKVKKGQKVYGIICLSSPSNDLVKKVNSDPRIKLFEYKIEYTEIK